MPAGVPQLAQRAPLSSRSPWWEEEQEPAEAAEETPAGAPAPLPGDHWPPLATVEYMTKLITLALILLAIPWLLEQLLHSPADGSSNAATIAGIGRVAV